MLMLINKCDLTEAWEVSEEEVSRLQESGIIVRYTSAKTGEGVEQAFVGLAEEMLEQGTTE